MKQLTTLLLALGLVVCLISCDGKQGSGLDFTVNDGAYGCTPQQLIDYLNTATKESDSEALPIPDFVESGERLTLSDTPGFFYLSFDTNDAGMIECIDFYFANAPYEWSEPSLFSAGFYLGVFFNELMSGEDADLVNAKIGSALSTNNDLYVDEYNQSTVSIRAKNNVCLIKVEAID